MIRIWFAHQAFTSLVIYFTIYFCVAYGCGAWMWQKGRNCVVGFLLAFCLPVLGLAIVAFYPPTAGRRRVRMPRAAQPTKDKRPPLMKAQRPAKHMAAEPAAPTVDARACEFCGMKLAPDAKVCRVCQMAVEQRNNSVTALA